MKRAPAKPSSRRVARPGSVPSQTDPAVTAFMRDLDHPRKRDIEAVRQILLGVAPEIHEGIKWNGPSFRTKDYFATVFLRDTDRVRLILHRGAKPKADSARGMRLADPAGLVEWLAKDRCFVTVGKGRDIAVRRAALEAIVREWLRQL